MTTPLRYDPGVPASVDLSDNTNLWGTPPAAQAALQLAAARSASRYPTAYGDRLKEATKINLSLSALGNVISALVAGKVGLSELTDGFVNQPPVREAMGKVQISTVDSQCPIEPVFSMHDSVQIVLNDGATLESGDIRFARGNAMAPLKGDDLRSKFLDCTASAADVDGAALYAKLTDLRSVRNMAMLAR